MIDREQHNKPIYLPIGAHGSLTNIAEVVFIRIDGGLSGSTQGGVKQNSRTTQPNRYCREDGETKRGKL